MGMSERLLAMQREWLQHERERRVLSNRRIRLVNDAVDGGMTHGEVARAMSGAGKPVTRQDVGKILACGYPADDAGEGAA